MLLDGEWRNSQYDKRLKIKESGQMAGLPSWGGRLGLRDFIGHWVLRHSSFQAGVAESHAVIYAISGAPASWALVSGLDLR